MCSMRCNSYDCGWCYDESDNNNSVDGACMFPEQCELNEGRKMERFAAGGIVRSTGTVLIESCCSICRKRTGIEKVEGEMIICSACSKTHFDVVEEPKITEQEALDRLGITKLDLDRINLDKHDQCLFGCE